MLLSLIKYTRGYVYVRLTGYAPERFLNLCGNRGILIWNLKPCEEGYEFCISINGFRRLKPILKKTKTTIHILKRKGLPFELYRYRTSMPSKQGTADHKGVRIYEPWHANQSDARWSYTRHPRLRSSPCEGNTLRSKLNASATARLPTEQGTAQAPGWPASGSVH